MKTISLIICGVMFALIPIKAEEYIVFNNTVYFTNGVSLDDLDGQADIAHRTGQESDGPYTIQDEIMRMMLKQPGKKILLKEVDYISEFYFWQPSIINYYDLYGTLNGNKIIFQKNNIVEREGNYGFLIILGYILAGGVICFLMFAIMNVFVPRC